MLRCAVPMWASMKGLNDVPTVGSVKELCGLLCDFGPKGAWIGLDLVDVPATCRVRPAKFLDPPVPLC